MANSETPMKGLAMFDRMKKFVAEHNVEIVLATVIVATVASVIISKKLAPAKDSILLEIPRDALKSMMDGGNAVLFDVDVDFALMVNYIPNHR